MNKYILVLMVIFIVFLNIYSNNNSSDIVKCPISISSENFESIDTIKYDIDKKMIAFEGIIENIHKVNNFPFIELKVSPNKNIYCALLFPIDKDVSLKDNIRVLGFFNIINDNDDPGLKYNKLGYQIICIGLVQLKSEQLYYNKKGFKQISIWINGKIPN